MLIVDYQILQSVATCDLQAWLRHVGGWTSADENASLMAGKAMHLALAAWFRSLRTHSSLSSDAALVLFGASYRAWAEAHAADLTLLSWPNTRAVVQHWFEHVAPSLEWKVLGVEDRRERVLTDDILYRGRLDLRILDPVTGEPAVVDHKTTQRLGEAWVASWELDAQMTGYAWLLGEGEQATRFYVNGIEWTRLPTSERTCKQHGTPFTVCRAAHANVRIVGPFQRTARHIARWRQTAIFLAELFRSLTAWPLKDVLPTGEFRGACTRCAFQAWCILGRHEEHLDRMFVRRPWTPGGQE